MDHNFNNPLVMFESSSSTDFNIHPHKSDTLTLRFNNSNNNNTNYSFQIDHNNGGDDDHKPYGNWYNNNINNNTDHHNWIIANDDDHEVSENICNIHSDRSVASTTTITTDRVASTLGPEDDQLGMDIEEESTTKKSSGTKKSICKKLPRFAFQTRSQVDILDDGYRWRKYGQKSVKNNTFPRSYYRCTHEKCNVKKQVQRLSKDEGIVVTTYEGTHSHPIHKPTDNFNHILTQMQIYTSI